MKFPIQIRLWPIFFLTFFLLGIVQGNISTSNAKVQNMTLDGQTPISSAAPDINLEREKLDIEQKKLDLERLKVEIEQSNSRWIKVPVFITLLVAAITVWVNIWSQRQQARNAFDIKAAEIIMNSKVPDEVTRKAEVISSLFPNRVTKKFAKSFNPSNYYEAMGPDRRADFIKLLIENWELREEIISMYSLAYNQDPWFKTVAEKLLAKAKDKSGH
jgi:hypothetical protein